MKIGQASQETVPALDFGGTQPKEVLQRVITPVGGVAAAKPRVRRIVKKPLGASRTKVEVLEPMQW